MTIFKEGIFRRPRLKTNRILRKYAHLFKGNVINVSGSSDSDKDCNILDYYLGNYDKGNRYKEYFTNATNYYISNYPLDTTEYSLNKDEMIFLDLEADLPESLKNKYDVVFCHTVFEHIFDIFTAFKNLCNMSNDIVIFIVPQFQMIHDYKRGYKDYWRFTPFAVEKLFSKNGYKVIYREVTSGFSESMYLFYIATKQSNKWEEVFPEMKPIEKLLCPHNNGINYTFFSRIMIKFDTILRQILKPFSSPQNRS